MSAFVGIDVSKAKLDVVVLIQEQQTYQQVANDASGIEALCQWLLTFEAIDLVCLEATGRYGEAAAAALYGAGLPVSVVNPARIKAFAGSLLTRNKTDKYDAYLIALFAQRIQPDPWSPPSTAHRFLKQRTRLLRSLEQTAQGYRNRLKAGADDPLVLTVIQGVLDDLQPRIDSLQKAIFDFLKQHVYLNQQRQLLTSIPGIGDKTAAVLLAEIGDIHNFHSTRQLAAYVGVTPRNRQSGSSLNKPARISKQGNARLRTALYFPAISAKKWNPICHEFAQRLEHKGKAKKAIIIAVMRKLLHQVYGILKSGQPFDPHFLEESDFAA